MQLHASSWCQTGTSIPEYFGGSRPCGVLPRSTSLRRVSRRRRRGSCRGGLRTHRKQSTLSMRWDFALAYLFPPIPLLKRVMRKLELSRGTFLLVTPYWEAQTWFACLQALQVQDIQHLPYHDKLVIDLSMGKPPPSLEQLFLVAWKICGGLGESTPSLTSHSGLLRQDGSDPQRINTKGPGNPSSPSCALPPFLSVKPF
jgi:hypothetical protein